MGVLTEFFRATEAELRAHYPTWKVPLQHPVRRLKHNPFLGHEVEVLSWDPDPDETAEDDAIEVLSPSIDMKGLDPESVAALIALENKDPKEVETRFLAGALIGPEDGPWVYEVPMAFVAKLAALDGSAIKALADHWSCTLAAQREQLKPPYGRGRMFAENGPAEWNAVLVALAEFARQTVAAAQRMYMWVCL